MNDRLPKITPQRICKVCGGQQKYFVHDNTKQSFGHKYVPRWETEIEAAYRQGYDDSYAKAIDKVHWGSGWD